MKVGETAPNAVLEKAIAGYNGGDRPQRGIRKGYSWLLSRL